MVKIICIDPGHGGLDPGGGTNSLWKEKDMVLQISFEQKRHFERHGIKVVMTRTTDEYLDSVPRTNRVKNSGAKYCISNHINAYNGQADGAETIHSIHANPSIATGVLDAIVVCGAKRRRVFSRKNSSGGDWYFMHRLSGNVNVVIAEYGFADNTTDTQKILKDWKKYAEAVARYYIEHVFKQKYIPEKEVADVPKPVNHTPSDTHSGAWKWAETNKLFNGKDPKKPITREQVATVLQRFNNMK
ncbi:N-acetylmuramoyl-L-alanine amidase family protein [Sporosarcina sp. CAU 1771]